MNKIDRVREANLRLDTALRNSRLRSDSFRVHSDLMRMSAQHRAAMAYLTNSMNELRDSVQNLMANARKVRTPAHRRMQDEAILRDHLFRISMLVVGCATVVIAFWGILT